MASIYRRKQDAILGLDNSSFIATSDTLANAIARHRGEAEDRSNENHEENTSDRIANSRNYARSHYENNTNDYDEVSDMDDSDEDGRLQGRRPSKADYILGRDTMKSSGISSKAQKLLGISETAESIPEPRLPVSQHMRSISPDRESIAPKALRTLGLDSRHGSRALGAHERSPKHMGAFDPNDFQRILSFNARSAQPDNRSNTDTSSQLSRESTVSWRTETPRSSQEVQLEDLKWRNNRSTAFTKRKDSLFDMNATLSEPFSPMTASSPISKSDHSNEFSFELPADVPIGYYGSEKNAFIAELPGASPPPVYEMPAYVPELVELPGHMAVDEKHPDLGIPNPHIAELYSDSPVKASIPHTEAVGESFPLKISPKLRTSMTAQSPRAVSVPRSSSVPPPMSSDSARERGPIAQGLRKAAMARVRSEGGFGRIKTRDMVTKARSTEFPPQSYLQSPLSPTSASHGLAAIAAKAGTAIRQQECSAGPKLSPARSKFNPEVQAARRDASVESQISTKQALIDDHGDDDEMPKQELQVTREAVNDVYPDSPVTGHFAGHPAFNKPLPMPDAELSQPLPPPSLPVYGEDKAHASAEKPADPSGIERVLSPGSKIVSNLKKQGLI